MAVDSFSHSSSEVLNDLDPLSRALLDLSVQRGMDDGEIAGVLGTDAESVFEVRVGLLRALADKVAPEHVNDDVPQLQAVITERLYAGSPANGAPKAIPVDEVPEIDDEVALEADDLGDRDDEAEFADAPAGAPEPAAMTELPAQDEPDAARLRPMPDWATESAPARPSARTTRKRRSPLTILLPLLALVAIAAGAFALTSGGDDEPAPQPAGDQPAPTAGDGGAAADADPVKARLEPIGSGDARGTAALTGDRLELKLRGLADPDGGSYEVWLYDSVIDAKPLGASQDTTVDLDVKLPPNARDYEYVDVSLEPADGNRNHSGQSVLRVPLSELTK